MADMTWQPMETAPKDGTPVDLWIIGPGDEVDFYCPEAGKVPGKPVRHGRATSFRWAKKAANQANWYPSGGLGYPLSPSVLAIAWMRLPDPPSGLEQLGKRYPSNWSMKL